MSRNKKRQQQPATPPVRHPLPSAPESAPGIAQSEGDDVATVETALAGDTETTAVLEQPSVTESAPGIAQSEGGDVMGRTQGGERRYYARRPFGYAGSQFDREQIIRLVGQVNDEKLVRLGYVAELPVDAARGAECRHCPATFVSQSARDAHGRKRHSQPDRPEMPGRQRGESEDDFELRRDAFLAEARAFEDATDHETEREERQLNETAPLYLDKTAASRG